jgi:hypothetical protein
VDCIGCLYLFVKNLFVQRRGGEERDCGEAVKVGASFLQVFSPLPLSCQPAELVYPHYDRAKRDSCHERICGVTVTVGIVGGYDFSNCRDYDRCDYNSALVDTFGDSNVHCLDYLHDGLVYGQPD